MSVESPGDAGVNEDVSCIASTRQHGGVMVSQVDLRAVALICHRRQMNMSQHIFPSRANSEVWTSPPLAGQASLKCCPFLGF